VLFSPVLGGALLAGFSPSLQPFPLEQSVVVVADLCRDCPLSTLGTQLAIGYRVNVLWRSPRTPHSYNAKPLLTGLVRKSTLKEYLILPPRHGIGSFPACQPQDPTLAMSRVPTGFEPYFTYAERFKSYVTVWLTFLVAVDNLLLAATYIQPGPSEMVSSIISTKGPPLLRGSLALQFTWTAST
jgi:hypothetical protein